MADLAVKVKGDTTNLNNALDRAGKKVAKTGQRMENLGSKLSKGISAPMAAAAGATAGLAIRAGRAADKLLDTEQQTGLTTKAIQEYRAVADRAGVSTDVISGAAEMLNQRMRQLKTDSSNASLAFKELNIQTRDSNGNLRDNSKMFSEVITKLSGLENQTRRNKLASQLFGDRWKQIAPVLGLGADQISKTRDKASQLGQVMSKDTIKAANSFRQSFDSLSRTVSVLFTKLGARLAPVMENTVIPIFRDKVVPALQKAVQFVGRMADKFGSLPQPVKNTALALTGLAVAMPPVILGGGKILKILPKAFRAMAASAKISAATTKRALISTGIGAFAVAIGYAVNQAIKHWDELTSFFEGTGLTPMLESIGKAAKDAGEVLVGAFVVVKRKVGQAINFVTDLFSDNASELGQIARTAARVVTQGFQALWSRAQTVFSGVADIVGSVIGFMKNAFQFWYNLLTGDPQEALGALERAVKYMALGIVQAIDTMISTVIETVADFVHYIDKAFGTDMEGALDNASKSVSQFAKYVKKELGLEEQQKQIDDTQKSLMSFGGTLENIGSKTLDSLNFGSSGSGSGSEDSEDDGGISKSSMKSGGEDSEVQKNEKTPGQAQTIPADQLKDQLQQVETAMKEQRIAEIWEGVSNRISKAGEAMAKSFGQQIRMAGKSAKSMGEFASQIGSAVEDSISAFVAEGVTSVVSGALKANSIAGPAAIPIAAAAGAAAQALFKQVIPEFATGGGVQGETLAKLGDYPGSYANPEVALRMDQIQRMMPGQGEGGGSQDVEFVLDGNELKGLYNSDSNRKTRMGL
jgi:hypothetical protein